MLTMKGFLKKMGCAMLIALLMYCLFYVFIIYLALFHLSPLPKEENVAIFSETSVFELAKAVEKDDAECVERMLNANPSIDIDCVSKSWNMTLLEWALVNEKEKSFDCLLKHGADPFAHSIYSAFDLTVENCNVKALNSILTLSPRIELMPSQMAGSALAEAYTKCEESLSLLLKNDIHKKDVDGYSVYVSIIKGDYAFAQKLMDLGVPFNDSIAFKVPYTTHNVGLDKTICYYILENEDKPWKKRDEVGRESLIKYLSEKKGIDVFEQ